MLPVDLTHGVRPAVLVLVVPVLVDSEEALAVTSHSKTFSVISLDLEVPVAHLVVLDSEEAHLAAVRSLWATALRYVHVSSADWVD